MQQTLGDIRNTLKSLKSEIMADDKQYLAYCKEVQVTQIVQEKQHKQDLILFS